jgi:hypothetical protein
MELIFQQDGVLIRGPNVLPTAKRALSILEGDNPFGWCVQFSNDIHLDLGLTVTFSASKIPYILVPMITELSVT